jgi:hypothetical protein
MFFDFFCLNGPTSFQMLGCAELDWIWVSRFLIPKWLTIWFKLSWSTKCWSSVTLRPLEGAPGSKYDTAHQLAPCSYHRQRMNETGERIVSAGTPCRRQMWRRRWKFALAVTKWTNANLSLKRLTTLVMQSIRPSIVHCIVWSWKDMPKPETQQPWFDCCHTCGYLGWNWGKLLKTKTLRAPV